MHRIVSVSIIIVAFALIIGSLFVGSSSAGGDMVDVTRTFENLFGNDTRLENNQRVLCNEVKKIQKKLNMPIFLKEEC